MATDEKPVLRPHPPLTDYYGVPENRQAFVRRLFDDTARHYDGVNTLLSLGSGQWYRRDALKRAGLLPGMRMLDVATGTGLLAREALAVLGPTGALVGLDPSAGMLAAWRGVTGTRASLVRGTAEALPVADASFDFVALGYAMRHIPDLHAAFAEFHRVLRPGGRVLVLEKVRPRSAVTHAAARFWFGSVVPALSRFSRGGHGAEMRTLMRYYWDTVEHCVAPEAIMTALSGAGFQRVACDRQLDMFGAYTAAKPG